ncbi:hypothetical protein G6L37_07180 [Agrobacterium rubi]|nr:hypothetical protein [Agrobacterium rubi]NTF25149.1 hypothetical protein [Agrobacterium rubi]
MDFRTSIVARQISDRTEWAVNAQGALMLSVPHVLPSPPNGISVIDGRCTADYGAAGCFPVPVPALIAPFLESAATILLVTFRRTNIVSERDVFVNREGAKIGE